MKIREKEKKCQVKAVVRARLSLWLELDTVPRRLDKRYIEAHSQDRISSPMLDDQAIQPSQKRSLGILICRFHRRCIHLDPTLLEFHEPHAFQDLSLHREPCAHYAHQQLAFS